MARRLLILGGTTEARQLAARLAADARLDVVLSLAGRTANPLRQPVPIRRGGFGGPEGLAAYLEEGRIDALVDATHPYAVRISASAAWAAARVGTPLLALRRPPWTMAPGDRWLVVADAAEAAAALGDLPHQVFLALGRQDLAAFERAPQHGYLLRSVDPVDPPLALPHVTYIQARGPFAESEERALLEAHGIDIVVTKNSGGTATYGKIAAARQLGLPVIVLRRPAVPDTPAVATVDEAVAWLSHALSLPPREAAEKRGV